MVPLYDIIHLIMSSCHHRAPDLNSVSFVLVLCFKDAFPTDYLLIKLCSLSFLLMPCLLFLSKKKKINISLTSGDVHSDAGVKSFMEWLQTESFLSK